ncbi:hypothetical protein MA16_Dca001143 [Dendrobium catenatum]|uniref:Uncharacterized protein n=1 Tax=Dendrobium catenatum TaxID=906689 RepID=A0A2I0WLK6_9ASPA|nr:hypothetical protein MA16_Dca001143 [Dendrobium catenatum]
MAWRCCFITQDYDEAPKCCTTNSTPWMAFGQPGVFSPFIISESWLISSGACSLFGSNLISLLLCGFFSVISDSPVSSIATADGSCLWLLDSEAFWLLWGGYLILICFAYSSSLLFYVRQLGISPSFLKLPEEINLRWREIVAAEKRSMFPDVEVKFESLLHSDPFLVVDSDQIFIISDPIER